MTLENFVIENGTIITPFEELDNKNGEITKVEINENGTIDFVGLKEDNEENRKKYGRYIRINAEGKVIIPGLIDTHVHLNYEFEKRDIKGKKNIIDDIKEKIKNKSIDFSKQGVTGFILGTMAMPSIELEYMLEAIRDEMGVDNHSKLLGALIEGSFINPSMAGAMNQAYLGIQPEFYFNGLIGDFKDTIKKIVFAPEMDSSYYDFIEKTNEKGIVSSLGHSNATYDEAKKIFNIIKVINHYPQRLSGFHHRNVGIVNYVDDYDFNRVVHLETIIDNKHSDKNFIEGLVKNLKGKVKNWGEVLMLITDAINIIALSEKELDPKTGKEYEIKKINGEKIYFIDGAPYLDSDKKILCGSVLTMDNAIKNMFSWFNNPLDRIEIIKSATSTVAEVHNEDKIGSLKKGKYADLTIFNKIENENNYNIGDVECTMVKGKIKYKSHSFSNRVKGGKT